LCFDVPVFGLRIREAAMALLIPEVRQLAVNHGLPLPQREVDVFLQQKVAKCWPLIESARTTSNCDPKATEALERFVRSFEALDPATIESPEDWDTFVRSFVTLEPGEDWRELLHFEHVLSLFGFDQSTALALRHQTAGGNGEQTLEQVSLRWLSKCLGAYGPKGCFGDIVNLAYAVLGRDPEEAMSESATCNVLEEFGVVLRRAAKEEEEGCSGGGAFAALWMPTHLVHDAESDDIMTLAVLEYMHQVAGTELQVLLQLPEDPAFDGVADRLSAGSGTSSRCQVYRDPESGNGTAVASHFGL